MDKVKETITVVEGKGLVVCDLRDEDFGIKAVGRAKCDPRDAFDEDYGTELAKRKARIKLTRSKKNLFLANYEELQKAANYARERALAFAIKEENSVSSLKKFLADTYQKD